MSNNSNLNNNAISEEMMKHLTSEQIIEKVLHATTYACDYWIQQIDTSIPLAKLNGRCVEDKWFDCLRNREKLIITDFRHYKHIVDMYDFVYEIGDIKEYSPQFFNQPNMFMKFVDVLMQHTAIVTFDKYEPAKEHMDASESGINEKIEEEVGRLVDELNVKWKNSPNFNIAEEFNRAISEIYAKYSSKNTINNKKSMKRYNAFKKRFATRNSYRHCKLQINN